MIRKGDLNDLDAIEKIFTSVQEYEETHEAYTVYEKGVYPNREQTEAAIKAGTLYVLEENGDIPGYIVINNDQFEEYYDVDWRVDCSDEKVLVVHLITVRKDVMQKGCGERMLRFALEEGRKRGCRAVRLDTTSKNVPSTSLYRKVGFYIAGEGPMKVGRQVYDPRHLFLEYDLGI